MFSPKVLTSVLDRALEASVVGSFTNVGYRLRSATLDWEPVAGSTLDGKAVVVTGGSSGIGRATAVGLVQMGARVHLTSRTMERAQETADALNAADHPGTAVPQVLETSDPASIRALAAELGRVEGEAGIEVLIHNAGALSGQYATTPEGLEQTVASHLVGPYLLTTELRPHLAAGARVLFMSSGGMYTQSLDVDSIEMKAADYKGAVAYAKAKRAQVELVRELGPEWAPDVVLHAVHPGWVDTPGVDAALPGFGAIMGPLLRTPEQGADTVLWLAATGGHGKPGRFWFDRRVRGTSYVPGTSTSAAERRRLVTWLDQVVANLAPTG